jgi:sugar lactone lactonase YvrE
VGRFILCALCLLVACSETTGSGGSGGGAGAGGGGTSGGGGAGGAGGFDPLEGIGMVELIDDSFVFTEGPTWRAEEGRLLFSDIPINAIYELTLPDSIVIFRENSGNANGLDSDPEGLLLAAEHLNRRISRTLSNGTIVDVATEYEGNRLNSPNDIAVRSDGTIYFTDPPYGITDLQRELDFNGVFRVDPAGELSAEWEGAISTRPNGLVLSPDETILYVADTEENTVAAFDVASDGSLSGRRLFLQDVDSPDGMAIDSAGNLFVTTSTSIRVFDPEGNEWGAIDVDGKNPANCAFGGDDARTLFITAREGLYQVRLAHPGLY